MARLKLQLGRSRSGEARGGRVLATVFSLFFFGMGSLFTVFMVRELISGAETYTWTERNCEIDTSEVDRRSGEEPCFPTVRYHTADGGPRQRNRAQACFLPHARQSARAAHAVRHREPGLMLFVGS